ncbi:MAG: hypothetical protein HWN80_03270 [Candidatus Lokiarchaeota archaeon]|nr:hypothetical protein [Candidatus Lokiarchaeota archaeon]
MENKDASYKKVKCEHCGKILVAPYHEDCICINCDRFSINIFRFMHGRNDLYNKAESRDFKIVSSKKSNHSEKKMVSNIPKNLQFYGIVSKERIPIYYNDKEWKYFLALTNDLDIISTSTLSGTLDKMLIMLEDQDEIEEKMLIARFSEKNGIIHILIGNFSDKESDWIFNQVSMFFTDMLQKDKINIKKLTKIEKHAISFKMDIFLHNMEEAVESKVKFEKPNFNYIDNWLRLYYFGLSSESVSVISLLLDKENILKFGEQKHFEPDSENDVSGLVKKIIDYGESVLTAKIEVILASIFGNMKGYPRWISIKSGFQKYFFLSFKKLENQFFLYCITEGNIEKLKSLESFLYMHLKDGVSNKFISSLKIFNEMKVKIRDIMEIFPERKFY